MQELIPNMDLSTMPPATMSPLLTVALTVVLFLIIAAIGWLLATAGYPGENS